MGMVQAWRRSGCWPEVRLELGVRSCKWPDLPHLLGPRVMKITRQRFRIRRRVWTVSPFRRMQFLRTIFEARQGRKGRPDSWKGNSRWFIANWTGRDRHWCVDRKPKKWNDIYHSKWRHKEFLPSVGECTNFSSGVRPGTCLLLWIYPNHRNIVAAQRVAQLPWKLGSTKSI